MSAEAVGWHQATTALVWTLQMACSLGQPSFFPCRAGAGSLPTWKPTFPDSPAPFPSPCCRPALEKALRQRGREKPCSLSSALLTAARSGQHWAFCDLQSVFLELSLRKHVVYLPCDPRGQCHQAFLPSIRWVTTSLHCPVCVLLTNARATHAF